MSNIKAVLLDIDGTVLNTLDYIYQAFQAAFAANNLHSPTREEIRLEMAGGGSLQNVYNHFYPEADIVKLIMDHRNSQLKNLNLAPPYPNVASTLQKLKAAGIKIAAVSTRSNITLTKTLEWAGVAQYFDVIITEEDTEKHKPDPAPLFLALERLQVLPAEAVMVGDTDADMSAGKSAGTKTIGVTFGYRGEEIANDKPDFVIHDFAEILDICLPPITT